MPKCTSRRRLARRILCNGVCGISKCNFVADSHSKLNRHVGDKTKCYFCSKTLTQKAHFYTHFRKEHSHLLLSDGSCPEYGVPVLQKRMKLPSNVCITKFRFIKRLIRRCISDDMERFKLLNKKPEKYADLILNYNDLPPITNLKVHEIAFEWYNYLEKNNRFETFQHECGISIKYAFREHGGLFQFSLDRINNDKPHFSGENPAFSNVRDVPLHLNTSCNPLQYYDNFKIGLLERRALLPVQTSCHVRSIMYNSINYAWSCVRKTRKVEKTILRTRYTRSEYFKLCFEIAERQGFRCAVSGIAMVNGMPKEVAEKDKIFAFSLNAIDPRKFHVVENLEWVCRCFNPTNTDKMKLYKHENDKPTSWSKNLFEKYYMC